MKAGLLSMVLVLAWMASPAGVYAQGRSGQEGSRPARQVRMGPPGGRQAGPAILDRLDRMTPEQRRRLLDRLPPERRERIERRLRQYQSLTPEQRENLRRRFERFRELPPEKQDSARKLFRIFNNLPSDRRDVVRREYRNLQRMGDTARKLRLTSDDFRTAYNASEQQLLQDLIQVAP
jgi:hypothetical protein